MSYGDYEPKGGLTEGPPGGITDTANREREVRFEHAQNLGELLTSRGLSILLTTYQANKLVVVCGIDGRLELSFHDFDRPMGLAIDKSLDRMAVATREKIWFGHNEVSIARRMPNAAGTCFLLRSAQVTGDISSHQIAFCNDALWIVNTRFSCLCTLDERHSFVPRWRPAFIDQLAAEDRCHLNGLATSGGKPKFVTALAQSNFAEGWRADKQSGGCLIDVDSNEVVAQGLAMPHSPVVVGNQVLFLESARGSLACMDQTGKVAQLARFPGFTRGLAVYHDLAIIGLSEIRDTSAFGDLPISQRHDLKCGFAILDLRTGKLLSQFEFKSGIDEIFDIAVVPHPGRTFVQGPRPDRDQQDTVWVLPRDAAGGPQHV